MHVAKWRTIEREMCARFAQNDEHKIYDNTKHMRPRELIWASKCNEKKNKKSMERLASHWRQQNLARRK